jgi:hypothetical protein
VPVWRLLNDDFFATTAGYLIDACEELQSDVAVAVELILVRRERART